MTTRTITGTYSAGYTLSPTYSQIRITPSGDIGGAGLSASAVARVLNFGSIVATSYGDNGVSLGAGGQLYNNNADLISGAEGVAGAQYGSTQAAANGGQGGGGAVLSSSGSAANHGTILGGAGGLGGYYYFGRSGGGGNGGTGGAAMTFAAGSAILTNSGRMVGGVGGDGGYGYSGALAAGGQGGAGLSIAGTVARISNSGQILGGAGGAAGSVYGSDSGYRLYGLGGAGGAGVIVSAAHATLANSGQITGGNEGFSFISGVGGDGAIFLSTGAVVGNHGSISGGDGSSVSTLYRLETAGAGGVGLTLASGARLTNAGLISGGNGGAAMRYEDKGGAGGAGLVQSGGIILNSGRVIGGAGGVALDTAAFGGVSGDGGSGMLLSGAVSLSNSGTITGGLGGQYAGGAGGIGIDLTSGGHVVNAWLITGGAGGSSSYQSYSAGAGGDGASLSGGVSLVNSGSISGGQGGQGGYGRVKNGGAGGAGGTGVYLSGGQISNTGAIFGGLGGTGGAAGKGKSAGATGAGGDGVVLASGNLINGAKGSPMALISGAIGVYAKGAATVSNFGIIRGTGGISVDFLSTSDRLIAQAGSTFIGKVEDGRGTLELASGVGAITGLGVAGTITGAVAMTFDSVSDLILDNGSAWTMSGANTVRNGQTLTAAFGSMLTIGGGSTFNVQGTLSQSGNLTVGDTGSSAASVTIQQSGVWQISGNVARGAATANQIINNGLLIGNVGSGYGGSTIYVNTVNNGTIEAVAGTLVFYRAMSGTGKLKIDANAALEADSGVGSGLSLDFSGANARLALKQASVFAATISGFASGDTIDLLGITATGASVNGADQLVIVNGTTTIATLQLSGSYAGATFATRFDGYNGTNVTLSSSPSPHLLTAAMAAMVTVAGATTTGTAVEPSHAPVLARPAT